MYERGNNKKIVVIGDIMLDEYVWGTINRVSPESCCPVLLSNQTSFQLGGAANVAYQIHALGNDVILAGVIGHDEPGNILAENLLRNSIDCRFVFKHDIVTTTKKRYVNDVHQQMFRVDKEERGHLSTTEISNIVTYLKQNAESINCIVLSDYNKGVLTNESCQSIITAARIVDLPIIIDIKTADIARYKGATIIKGNSKEIGSMLNHIGISNNITKENICFLKQQANVSLVVVTLGKEGIAGIDNNNNYIKHNANQVLVYDVTGAGDIVTAYISVLFNIKPFGEVLKIANKAAGIKVTKFGNSKVLFNEVIEADNKIKEAYEISSIAKGEKIVFTNGCFDILHAGHVDLLQYAKSKGDILVVGLNTDESIRRIKGKNRPVNNLEMRIKVLSAICVVDYIVCFREDTPEKIIHEIKPDVLIKGGDYTLENIVGADYVLKRGGIVEAMPIHYHVSTTQILSSL